MDKIDVNRTMMSSGAASSSGVGSVKAVSLTDVTAHISPTSVHPPTKASLPGPVTDEPEAAFPAVLKGSQKQKVPPPVPPRGSPKTKRGGGTSACSIDTKAGAPPLSCCSTPPPPFEDVSTSATVSSVSAHTATCRSSRTNSSSTTSSSASMGRGARRTGASSAASVLTTSSASSLALTPAAVGSARSHDTSVCWTPPISVEGSTPTWTEGTPSFTESSCSEGGYPTTPARGATPDARSRSPRAPPPPPTRGHGAPTAAAINCLTSEMVQVTQIATETSKMTLSHVEIQLTSAE